MIRLLEMKRKVGIVSILFLFLSSPLQAAVEDFLVFPGYYAVLKSIFNELKEFKKMKIPEEAEKRAKEKREMKVFSEVGVGTDTKESFSLSYQALEEITWQPYFKVFLNRNTDKERQILHWGTFLSPENFYLPFISTATGEGFTGNFKLTGAYKGDGTVESGFLLDGYITKYFRLVIEITERNKDKLGFSKFGFSLENIYGNFGVLFHRYTLTPPGDSEYHMNEILARFEQKRGWVGIGIQHPEESEYARQNYLVLMGALGNKEKIKGLNPTGTLEVKLNREEDQIFIWMDLTLWGEGMSKNEATSVVYERINPHLLLEIARLDALSRVYPARVWWEGFYEEDKDVEGRFRELRSSLRLNLGNLLKWDNRNLAFGIDFTQREDKKEGKKWEISRHSYGFSFRILTRKYGGLEIWQEKEKRWVWDDDLGEWTKTREDDIIGMSWLYRF